jgi:hypothetical protein
MIYRTRSDVFTIHHQRREQLRLLKGDFKPTDDDLQSAKERFFQKGGQVTRLRVTSETKPGVWGDFVKSRVKAS